MNDPHVDSQNPARSVTFRGEPFALAGEHPAVGAAAPNFTVCGWHNAAKVDVTLESLLAAGGRCC